MLDRIGIADNRLNSTTVYSVSEEIVPDNKNWTWVLERPCHDCGFNASSFEANSVGVALRDLGDRWLAVLQRSDARVRPRSGVWSPLEYGCHVRDVFRKFDERVQMMVHELDPHFENWDQDKAALEDDYPSQVPAEVADELQAAAEKLAGRFDRVSADEWSRRGFRSDGSAFTIESIARYLIHDPVHHLWDVGSEIPVY